MRFKGVHHVEFSVLDYENSIAFYDRMFGWLGYGSFWTLDVEYRSTYYMTSLPFLHSYIGIQPAKDGSPLNPERFETGINYIALWARSRKEVDDFYAEFLLPHHIPVLFTPEEYPIYYPGYYAVFFQDPSGIKWELAFTPLIPSPRDVWKSLKIAAALKKEHPEWKRHPAKEAIRSLPTRRELSSKN
jgi:catechol 2,3-dioxygenase-like lactoylglutathione lyase family enzyme